MDTKTKELVVRLQKDPENLEALRELREHLEAAGMTSMLAKTLQWWASTTSDPKQAASALCDAGRVFVEADRDQDKAMALFKKAIAKFPQHDDAHLALVDVYKRVGTPSGYADYLRQQIGALGSQGGPLYSRLGKFLRSSSDLDGAVEAFESALKLAPGSTAIAYDLAESLIARRGQRGAPLGDADATRAADLLVSVARAVGGEQSDAYLSSALKHAPAHREALEAWLKGKPAGDRMGRLEAAVAAVSGDDELVFRRWLAEAYHDASRTTDGIAALRPVAGRGDEGVNTLLAELETLASDGGGGDLLGMLEAAAEEDMRASLESGSTDVLDADDLVLEGDVELDAFPTFGDSESPLEGALDEATVIDAGLQALREEKASPPSPPAAPQIDLGVSEPTPKRLEPPRVVPLPADARPMITKPIIDGAPLPIFDDEDDDDEPMLVLPAEALLLPDGRNPKQPEPPSRRRALFVHLGAAGGSLLVHTLVILSLFLVVNTLGINLEVEDRTQEELYAEGLIEPPERPPPEERPPPPRPRRQNQPERPQTDRTVRLPETLQKVLQRVNENRSNQNQTDRLLSAFAGEGSSLAEVTTNIDAVAGGANSGALRFGGTLSALEGVAGVNVGTGGGGDLGTIGGSRAVKNAGQLNERATGPVRGRVRAVAGLSRVSGSLSRGEVQAVINRYIGRIRGCYERALSRNPGLSGQARFAWTITGSGGVSGVRSAGGNMSDPQVVNCISGVIRRMRFPRPQGGSVAITYPFMFQRSQ